MNGVVKYSWGEYHSDDNQRRLIFLVMLNRVGILRELRVKKYSPYAGDFVELHMRY